MRILMISTDKKILEQGSAQQRRHFEYGKICDELNIIVLGNSANKRECEREFTRNNTIGNVHIYAAGGRNKIGIFLNACIAARKIIREKKITLITTQDAAYTGLIGYCLKKKFKVELNIQIHGQEEKLLNKILFFSLTGKIIKSADSVRVVSERLKKWIMRKYRISGNKIFVIPIYSEIELRSKNQEVRNKEIGNWKLSGTFTILTAGRLVKVKNIGLQIEALADVVKIFPETQLLIVGDGPEKENLRKIAKKFKVNDRVEFAGWRNDLKNYYKNADLFLLTSNNEGWGLAVIDAMRAGCLVVMTDVGCAGELVENEENGIVIPIRDKKALVAAICNMIADGDKRKKFAENAKITADKLPDKSETMRIYREMWKLEIRN